MERIFDPRLWAIKRPWSILFVFLGLNLLFVWGNVRTRKGSIVDDEAILNTQDPVRQMASYVEGKMREGFQGTAVKVSGYTFSLEKKSLFRNFLEKLIH